jgi:hypothetical protein
MFQNVDPQTLLTETELQMVPQAMYQEVDPLTMFQNVDPQTLLTETELQMLL